MKASPLSRLMAFIILCAVLATGVYVCPPASAAGQTYILELVTGETNFFGGDLTANINYFDDDYTSYTATVNLSSAFEASFPGKTVNPDRAGYYRSLDYFSWMDQNCANMMGNARAFIGNYYDYAATDTALLPYTATDLKFTVPTHINTVTSITITVPRNDALPGNLELQSVRVFSVSGELGDSYWNAAFSRERLLQWKGELVAQTKPGEVHHITNGGSTRFMVSKGGWFGDVRSYYYDERQVVDNTGIPVGVSIQLADVLGAGVETLSAPNRSYSTYKGNHTTDFPADNYLTEFAGENGFYAYWNMYPFRAEFMTLEVRYKDVLGASRRVKIPFYTTYLCYLLNEFDGKFCAGRDADFKSWCAGLLQQNENIGLPFRLAQYKELTSISLTYGAAPEGMTHTTSGFTVEEASQRVDTSSDPIVVENICFYENVAAQETRSGRGMGTRIEPANFKTVYDTEMLGPRLDATKDAAWSYSANSYTGVTLSKGSSISAEVGDGLEKGPAKARDYTDRYVVRLTTADVQTAGTTNPVSISFTYTTNEGKQVSTPTAAIAPLVEAFYGKSFRDADSDYQYKRHLRRGCAVEFMVEMADMKTVDSVTLSMSGTNEWQVSRIEVKRPIKPLPRRKGSRDLDGNGPSTHTYWRRDQEKEDGDFEQVAIARQSVLLYQNSPSKTVNFTTYDEAGNAIAPEQPVKENQYLATLPSAMTYEETLKDLGLSVVKYNYQVDVKVADVEDAGSGNYFYFQLVFENGTSAVVLANQQLASDSFRRKETESFQIKTTQHYGNLVAVRIICDNTSSTSDVFDKLNIEKITVTLRGDTGVSRSWLVERVGWIDITYVDEGAETSVNGINGVEEDAQSNVEVLKEFPVTRTATAVDLLFCIATASDSSGDSSNTYENALKGGKFDAKLVYQDNGGVTQSTTFDLTEKLKAYNGTDKTWWLYRPNHADRFTLSMTDVRSIQSLTLSRSDGQGTWKVRSVSIEQIGGLGEVYLAAVDDSGEYYRDTVSAAKLASSTNAIGNSYSISGNGSATVSFTENTIDVTSQETTESWSATISRVPQITTEELNIALFPGSVSGVNYAFSQNSPAVKAKVKYTTIFGGTPVYNDFTLSSLGEVNGQTVLFGKGLKVSAMSSLSSIKLSSTSADNSGDQPYVRSAIVQRVRGGVLTDTYYLDFTNAYLGNGPTESSPTLGSSAVTPMRQALTLQPAAGQDTALTAETSDIAVALRYTSTFDPGANKSVYLTPYVYLTDAGYSSVKTGQSVEVPFTVPGVSEILGVSVISTGAIASFDNAVVQNWTVPPEGETATLLGTGSFPQSFTASAMETALEVGEETVTPVLLRFTTAAEEVARGAGTEGQVDMSVHYVDNSGEPRSMDFPDLARYLPNDAALAAGSTVETTLLLNDAAYLEDVTLTAQDPWFLSSLSAQLTLPGRVLSTGTTVNNWAGAEPLMVDLRPDAYRESPNGGNAIQSFSVTGRARQSGSSATAAAGSSLQVNAYPGDTVDLTPVITAVGAPDTSWTWNAAGYEGSLTVKDDGTATFFIPHTMAAGESCTFSVSCNGDNRRTVSITVMVEAPAPETTPEPAPVPTTGPTPQAGADAVPEPETTPEPEPEL